MQLINRIQQVALYIFFFSINFEMLVPFNAIGISLSYFTGILYFLTIIPEIEFFARTDRIGKIMLAAWLFFGLLTLMSLLNVNEVSKSFFNISIFQNIVLFWFLVNHARKDYLILEKGMLFFALGSIVLAFMYIIGYGVKYEGERLTMFEQNQNTLGINMCIGVIILLLSVIQNKARVGKFRYIFLAFLPLMVNFIFETGSRKAFISLVLCFITGILLLKTKRISGKFVAVSIGMVCLIILGTMLMQHDLLRDRLFKTVEEGDLAERDVLWSGILPLIKEKPLFGVGETGYSLFSRITFGELQSPHNVILEVICLTGFVGLLIYVSFLYQVFIRGYQVYRKSDFLLPILLAFPMLSIILAGQILVTKIGWIIFAYVIGSTAIKSQPGEKLTKTIIRK